MLMKLKNSELKLSSQKWCWVQEVNAESEKWMLCSKMMRSKKNQEHLWVIMIKYCTECLKMRQLVNNRL